MREISFRAWNKEEKFLDTAWSIDFEHRLVCHRAHNQSDLDDCVLMQYTGLKDKNGREIYEGDIIRHTENVRVGTTRSRRGRSRKYDTFAVYGDREVISVVRFDVFENTLGFITSTNSNTAYDSYFFGEGKRTDKPNLCIQNLTDRLNVKKEYEVIGNIYENPELLEVKGNE